MSRIRSIHPGLWTDEAFVSLSPLARLLFVGMWNECDDKGIVPWSPLKLKMRILPADNIDAGELLAEIEGAALVRGYDWEGKRFAAVRNFALYQRPKKPNSIHPASAEILRFAGHNTEQATLLASPVPNQFPPSGEKSPQREEGGGNRSSEAIASGGQPPALTAADITKSVWDSGKAILKAAGHDDRQAGSIIGRFRKMYSDSQVLIALSRCQIEQPSEPVEWLTKVLQSEAGNGRTNANRQTAPNGRAMGRTEAAARAALANLAGPGERGSDDVRVIALPHALRADRDGDGRPDRVVDGSGW